MRFSLALLPTFALRVRAALVAGSSKVWVALVWSSREASERAPYHRTGVGKIEIAFPTKMLWPRLSHWHALCRRAPSAPASQDEKEPKIFG